MADKLVRTSVVISLFLVIALFSGCGGRQTGLTGKDNGSTVALAPGESLVITLDSNPTTGYSWQVLELDGALLKMIGEPEYRPGSSQEGLVGAGGTETLQFEALKKGETTLTLGYARPWEGTIPPIETFTIRVLVE